MVFFFSETEVINPAITLYNLWISQEFLNWIELVGTAAASISDSCLWISEERGSSMHTKNKSDFPKNAPWFCLKNAVKQTHVKRVLQNKMIYLVITIMKSEIEEEYNIAITISHELFWHLCNVKEVNAWTKFRSNNDKA